MTEQAFTTIAERLRYLRKGRGWSRLELSKKTGHTSHARVSSQTVGNAEEGRTRRPTNGTVQAIAEALGVAPGVLRGQEPVPVELRWDGESRATALLPLSVETIKARSDARLRAENADLHRRLGEALQQIDLLMTLIPDGALDTMREDLQRMLRERSDARIREAS